MRILSPALFTTATEILFLSRKKARVEIQRIYPRDIYTGLELTKDVWTLEHVVPQSRIQSPGRKTISITWLVSTRGSIVAGETRSSVNQTSIEFSGSARYREPCSHPLPGRER